MRFWKDLATNITVIHRAWGAFSGIITILFISQYLSPEGQGYYYVMNSVVATQIFFELGLGQIIVTLVAHENRRDFNDRQFKYSEHVQSSPRLVSLMRILNKWYLISSSLYLALIFIALFWLFDNQGTKSDAAINIAITVVLITSVNLNLTWRLSVIEGLNFVVWVASIRLIAAVLGYILFWVGLIAGFGLLSVITVPLALCIFIILGLSKSGFIDFRFQTPPLTTNAYNWKKDILPFQWQIGLSWISGYFIFQVIPILVLKFAGPIEAGKFGLTVAIFSAINIISISWISTKTPILGQMISQNNAKGAKKLFFSYFLQTCIVSGLLNILVVLINIGVVNYGLDFAHRVLKMELILLFTLITLANTIIFSLASFMRTFKQEPLLILSVVVSSLSFLGSYIFVQINLDIVVYSIFIITVGISLPWTLLIFRKFCKLHGI